MAEVEPAFAATLSTPPRSRRQIHGTVARRLFANVATYIVVIGLAFGLGAAFVAITGSSPSAVVRALVDGSVGSPQSLSQTLSYALPIMVVAAPASKSRGHDHLVRRPSPGTGARAQLNLLGRG